MTNNNDPPVTPPNITEPPAAPPELPVVPPTNEGDVAARVEAIETSVGDITGVITSLAERLDAIINPTDPPTDPPVEPSGNPEVDKLKGELDLLKTAFAQETAAKIAESTARKTEMIDSIVENNPAYAAQKDTLVNMDEAFLAMLAEQSKPPEPRVRVAGGTKYTTEDYQSQAARLREERRSRSIR